jgi:hypothetical protein
MGKIQNLDMSLQDLVANINRGEYHIPKFQRDFVWKSKDIVSLGDSIIRSYPISSMLVMPINGTLTIGAGPLKTHDVSFSSKNGEYVLDGQQRITSIARIFLGLDSQKEYYFDLLSMLVERFPEDDITNDSGIQSKIVSQSNYNYSKISDIFCKSFNRSVNGDEKNTRQHNRFISGRAIIENRYAAVINKFLRCFASKNEDDIDKYTDYLNAVLGSVGGYGIPVTLISGDSDLGLVIRVFEKVNSTGKPLALFDLIHAKTFKTNSSSSNNEGLAEFLYNDISNYCKNHDNTKCIEQYFEYEPNHNQYKNLARVIRIISILEFLLKGNHPHFTKAHMFQKEAGFWFEMWKRYGEQILDTLVWLEEDSLVSLSNKILLEYMVPILIIFPALKQQSIFRDKLKKYILYSNIKHIGFSKTNLDIVMKFYEFAKEINNHNNSLYKHTVKLPINTELNLSGDDIANVFIGKSTTYNSILYILFQENHDAGNVDFTNTKIQKNSSISLDEHHIVPKSAVQKYMKNSIYNSIANVTLLNMASNRWEIKGTPFYKYIDQLKSIYSREQFEYILSQNFLDLDLIVQRASEEEILKKRAEDIAQRITNYFHSSSLVA